MKKDVYRDVAVAIFRLINEHGWNNTFTVSEIAQMSRMSRLVVGRTLKNRLEDIGIYLRRCTGRSFHLERMTIDNLVFVKVIEKYPVK